MRILSAKIFALLSLLSLTSLHAAPPQVDPSPDSLSGFVGVPFSYEITTSGDAPLGFGVAGDLPPGLTRVGSLISGTPEEAGSFPVTLSATNLDGSGTLAVTFEISLPTPTITSSTTALARVGTAFEYAVLASNAPNTFVAIGLDQLGVGAVTIDAATGVISGTPTVSGNFDIIISAENASGSASPVILNIDVSPEFGVGGIQNVSIISPVAASTASGSLTEITIVAEVTPTAGEEIDTVFVEWTNPPDNPVFNFPREEITLASLTLDSTDGVVFTYTGTVKLGFNPDDRELSGGAIDLRVRAFQTNAIDAADYGEATVSFEIGPVVEFVFPDEGLAMDSIERNDVFASARVSSNNINTVTARVSGESILDSVDGTTSFNGIYNFNASRSINFPGEYEVRLIATDTNGNATEITRSITISDSLAEPGAVITAPTPGFSNEVFTAAIVRYVEQDRVEVFDNATLLGEEVTYGLTLVNSGQGYFPRNATGATILTTAEDSGLFPRNLTIGIPEVTVRNGRIDSVPETFTVFYTFDSNLDAVYDDPEPQWSTSGTAIMDDLDDAGSGARIEITAQFFSAGSALQEFEIFVNGDSVLDGNLNSNFGIVDIPSITYPAQGNPQPGDYVVVAQVMDIDGEVGTSVPTTFTILPFEPFDITFDRVRSDEVVQGDSVTFEVMTTNADDIDSIETVTIFDSDSGEEIGVAPRVTIDGVDRFQFTQTYNQQGRFGLYAEAVTFGGQSARSEPIRFEVQPTNDLRATISGPLVDAQIFQSQSVAFTVDASSTAGITSVEWFVNNLSVETDTSEPFALDYTFTEVGSFAVRAVATDNFGNSVGTSEETVAGAITGLGELNVTVVATDLAVSLTEPTLSPTVVAGESVEFAASASATLGVTEVRWFVGGELVETDTGTPYALSQDFLTVGAVSVYAEAEDSLGSIRQTVPLTVTVNAANPLLREEDFVADIYDALVGSVPTTDQRDTALNALDGSIASRSAFIVELLQSDALETTVIVNLIYRTMTGEWPDSSALEAGRAVLTNGGTGTTSANALTADLVDEYEDRFAVLNTQSGFVNQLYFNKHGLTPSAQAEVRLFSSATGASTTLNGLTVPGYSGDLISFATQFALDNDASIYQGVDGLPLSALHLYSIPNNVEGDATLAALVAALWGTAPTDAVVESLAELSLVEAVSAVLSDERYFSQFSTATVDGFIASRMAELGVFDLAQSSPTADFDGDGFNNTAEIALGSDPLDSSDLPAQQQAAALQGSEFVFTYIRLRETVAPAGLSVTVECAGTLNGPFTSIIPEAIESLASDQSGLPSSDYERIELRVDMALQDCGFFRLSVEGAD